MKFASLLLVFFLSLSANCSAMKQQNGDFSLLPEPPQATSIFGLTLNESPRAVVESLRKMGLAAHSLDAYPNHPELRQMTVNALPPELSAEKGSTLLIFNQDKLVHVTFNVEPSYENFLLLKHRIGKSLGSRFKLQQSNESMDRYLQSHLAQLQDQEYNDSSEQEISHAMSRGSTYFFYTFKDSRGEMDVRYTYRGNPQQLKFSFTSQEILDHYRKEQQDKKSQKPLLPAQ